jgi:hypothetical protein
MTTQSSPRIMYLINTFADWLKHRRELELAVREIVDAGGEAQAVIGDASVEAVTRKTFPFGDVLECLLA